MKSRNQPVDLLDVAAAVGDGAAVDWAQVESQSTPAGRDLTGHLRVLERIATVHAGLPPVRTFEHSLHDSLLNRTVVVDESATAAPTKWGPLTIVEKIGSGTYADVYRAVDPRLDRPVALKLLRHRDAADAAVESEAIEEARLLARIRHPNVVTVYGADRIDGRAGIWMELVDGRTLEQELREHGPFPVEALVAVGTALCRALSAVHDAGLLHRDVKAQNAMRDRDGRVLLTDFGTGREVDQMGSTRELAGTPLYLAPEVLNGGAASIASDLYSLGVLLYHLATGSFPVSGRSLRDLVDAHARGARRPLREARPDLPARLASTIDRAATVDVPERFESAFELETALLTAASPSTSRRRVRLAAMVLAAIVVLLSIGYGASRLPALQAVKTAGAAGVVTIGEQVRQLTFSGDASGGAISRDGKVVVFIKKDSLRVRDVQSGQETEVLPAETGRHLVGVSLTPDATQADVVFRPNTSPAGVWRVPIAGGRLRLIAADALTAPGWAPDGQHMAFVTVSVARVHGAPTAGETSTSLVIAGPDGEDPRMLAKLHAPRHFVAPGFWISPATNRPAWSPDGQTIALAGLDETRALAQVLLVDTVTGKDREAGGIDSVSKDPETIELAWLDGTRLAVSQQATASSPFQIWVLDVPTRAFTAITNDLADYKGLSITGDRQTMVSTRMEDSSGIWVGGANGEGLTAAIASGAAKPAGATFDDHGDLVYSAATSDGVSVWLLMPGSAAPTYLARGSAPRVTPRGDRVVFVDRGERAGLYCMDLDGSHIKQLLDAPAVPQAIWDGREVLFIDSRSGFQSIWAVPINGGTPYEVAPRWAATASISRDGGRLAFFGHALVSDAAAIVVCDMPRCRNPIEFPIDAMARPATLTWMPDGSGIAFVRKTAGGVENIWFQPLDRGPLRQVTQFTDVGPIPQFSWSPDGSRLGITRARNVSDLVILKSPLGK